LLIAKSIHRFTVAERGCKRRENFEALVRRAFMAGNPAATEADWERLKGRRLDEALLAKKRPVKPPVRRGAF
jgi:hypothetical protein